MGPLYDTKCKDLGVPHDEQLSKNFQVVFEETLQQLNGTIKGAYSSEIYARNLFHERKDCYHFLLFL